ncbi:MAG: peptidoglycan-binding protein, partial [Alphaproteobacteria bacterium]
MLNRFYTAIIVLAMASTASTASLAQDLALIITNGNYHSGGTTRAVSRRHADLVEEYSDQGYEIIDAASMRSAVESFFDRAKGKDRVIVHFTGLAVHSGNQSWLLPVDIDTDSIIHVDYNAPSIDILLGVLGRHPGRGVMLLANLRPDDATAPLMVGAGELNIPQGVLMVSGPEDDLNKFVLKYLLTSSDNLADTLARRGGNLQIDGFVSPDISLVGDASETSDPSDEPNWVDLVAEQALWAVADKSDRREDFQEYLYRFPNGIFAPAAKVRLEALDTEDQTPADIETAMGLTRIDKRNVQENLTVLGFDTRGVDGIFGRGTRSAIAAWQNRQRLEATGYLAERQVSNLETQADARRREIRAEDLAYWEASGVSGEETDLHLYLDKYPEGRFASEAKEQLAAFDADARNQADQDAWRKASNQNTARSYRKYLNDFPEGIYAAIAEQRLTALSVSSVPDSEQNSAREQENRLNLNSGTRTLIENRLKSAGYSVGPADGVFDERTRRAIRAFQK